MKLKNLLEDNHIPSASLAKVDYKKIKENQFNDIWTKIENECQQIIQLYKEHSDSFLYRGSSNKPLFFKINPRQNRNPLHSGPEFQEAIDIGLKTLGFETLRSNSIFCSLSRSQAYQYGDVYILFPIDNFKYLWFQNSDDLYTSLNQFVFSEKQQILKNEFNVTSFYNVPANVADKARQKAIETIISNISKYIVKLKPRNNGLEKDVFYERHIGEIMISSPCYALDIEYKDRIIEKLNEKK